MRMGYTLPGQAASSPRMSWCGVMMANQARWSSSSARLSVPTLSWSRFSAWSACSKLRVRVSGRAASGSM